MATCLVNISYQRPKLSSCLQEPSVVSSAQCFSWRGHLAFVTLSHLTWSCKFHDSHVRHIIVMNCYRSRRLGTGQDSEARELYRLVIRQAALLRGRGLRLARLNKEIEVLENLARRRLMQVTRLRLTCDAHLSFQDVNVEEIAMLYS